MPNREDFVNPAFYTYNPLSYFVSSYIKDDAYDAIEDDGGLANDSNSASIALTDDCGTTSVELLGPNTLAIVQVDDGIEQIVVLSRDMCVELLGVLKTALV